MAPLNESATDEAGASSDTAAGMLPFQVQFIKNLIDESLDEFRQKQIHCQIFSSSPSEARHSQTRHGDL